MTLPTITYAEVINSVKTFIKNNCKNWSDNNSFASIPACYKSGWVTDWTRFAGNGSANKSSYYRHVLQSNNITETNYATLESNLTNFLSQINLAGNRINNNIAESEFINFLNDISSFCSSNCAYTDSIHCSDSAYKNFMIYLPSTTFMNLQAINTASNKKIIAATDATLVLNNVEDVIKQAIRTRNCIYTVGFITNP